MKMKCGCEITQVGVRPDDSQCDDTHIRGHLYACPQKGCPDYRPWEVPKSQVWPKCVCGEIAQEHNSTTIAVPFSRERPREYTEEDWQNICRDLNVTIPAWS